MAWDGIPWFVEGTTASEETLRLIVEAAASGGEGVIGPADLVVMALEMPDAAVQVGTGAMIARRRSGGGAQSYAARMPTPEIVSIEPTSADGPRSDLIIGRVEDPYGGEGWPEPADPSVGPYVYTRVVTDVPVGTTNITEIDDTSTAATLARIDIPAATSNITQGMVTDLREVARPRSQSTRRYLAGVWALADEVGELADWEEFPLGARWMDRTPVWATHATVHAHLTGLRHPDGTEARGRLRVVLGEQSGPAMPYAAETPGRLAAMAGHTFALTPLERGEVLAVTVQGTGTEGVTGVLQADAGTTLTLDIHYFQAPVGA
ncbi:hypothetical protein [Streptomyces scopuliridis]|uniref:hypothetical protein n=1 Tax=Streptomyces scopuliridis TaxID=452529 RepID=UPI0036B91F90